jgi:hypothetical protein
LANLAPVISSSSRQNNPASSLAGIGRPPSLFTFPCMHSLAGGRRRKTISRMYPLPAQGHFRLRVLHWRENVLLSLVARRERPFCLEEHAPIQPPLLKSNFWSGNNTDGPADAAFCCCLLGIINPQSGRRAAAVAAAAVNAAAAEAVDCHSWQIKI